MPLLYKYLIFCLLDPWFDNVTHMSWLGGPVNKMIKMHFRPFKGAFEKKQDQKWSINAISIPGFMIEFMTEFDSINDSLWDFELRTWD